MPDNLESIIQASLDAERGGPDPEADVVETVAELETVVAEPEVVTETPAADAIPADGVKPVEKPAAKAGDDDDFDKVPAREPNGRENRIPHSRVGKMVETGIKKFRAAEHEPLVQRAKTYEDRLERVGTVERIMFDKQDQFLDILETIPGYKEVFAKRFGSAAAPTTAAAAKPADDAALLAEIGPKPAPDYKDETTGAVGYTPEQHEKLLDWVAKKAAAEAVRTTEERLGKRIKPFEDSVQARQRQDAQAQQISSDLDKAAKWDGFVENAQAILDVLSADSKEALRLGRAPQLTLEDAYRQVVIPKLKTDRNKLREEILKELEEAPRSTSAGARATSRPAADAAASGPKDLDDIIKAELDKARRSGNTGSRQ